MSIEITIKITLNNQIQDSLFKNARRNIISELYPGISSIKVLSGGIMSASVVNVWTANVN